MSGKQAKLSKRELSFIFKGAEPWQCLSQRSNSQMGKKWEHTAKKFCKKELSITNKILHLLLCLSGRSPGNESNGSIKLQTHRLPELLPSSLASNEALQVLHVLMPYQ